MMKYRLHSNMDIIMDNIISCCAADSLYFNCALKPHITKLIYVNYFDSDPGTEYELQCGDSAYTTRHSLSTTPP